MTFLSTKSNGYATSNKWQMISPYLGASLVAVVLTLLGLCLTKIFTPTDQALIYISGIVFVAANYHRGPSFVYILCSVGCLNFFFIPPIYSFNVYDRSYWMTFTVMIITGFVITNQASRLRSQNLSSLKREHDTRTFYALTKLLTSTRGREDISKVTANHIMGIFDVSVTIWLPQNDGRLKPIIGKLPSTNTIKETSVVQWCFDNNQIAGRHTMTMPSAIGLYFPVTAPSGTLGVLGVLPEKFDHHFLYQEITFLETCSSLLASALERTNIADIAEKSKLEVETERLRTILLSSVSHDLRTPLASITGASSTILTDFDQISRETVRELSRSIHKEAERLSHIVTNLLEVTRLESGTVQLNKQPYYAEELIGSVLERQKALLLKHLVIPKSDENLPFIFVDGVLIEQVLDNLLENAVHYTPQGSTITISASQRDNQILIQVSDNGPGIPAGDEANIFRKFYSLPQNKARKGTGLGLAICEGIIKAHGGNIWVTSSLGSGCNFYFTIPISHNVDGGEINVIKH